MIRSPTTAKGKETAFRIILAVSVLMMLVLPFALFISELLSAHRQYRTNVTYEPVQAVVLSSRVTSYKGSKGSVHYAPDIHFQYEVGGKTYQSDRLMAVYVSADQEWAQAIVDRYKSGMPCTAFHNPNNPARAILLKRFTFQPYFYMLVMTFCLAAASFLISQLWTGKPRQPTKTDNGWFEIFPRLGASQRLLTAKVCAGIWHGLGAVPVAHYFAFVPGPHSDRVITRIAVFGLLGLVPVGFLFRYLWMNRGLADARLLLDQPVPSLGQSFKLSISQYARRDLEVKHARLKFLCVGTKVKGKSRTRSTLYESAPLELKTRAVHAGESLALAAELTLPPDKPSSGRDPSGRFTSIDWSIKWECRVAHRPNYVTEFPLTVLPVQTAPAANEPEYRGQKPRVLADVHRIDAEHAGRILSKSNIFISVMLGLLPIALLLAAITVMAVNYLVVFPDKTTPELATSSDRSTARRWFVVSAIVAGSSSIFGLLLPNFLSGSYLLFMAKRAVAGRRDAIVRLNGDSTFVDIVPRANWNRAMIENATDIGFLSVDAQRREIRFEGDRERYRIPAEALVSCELEKSLLVSTARPDAPGVWLAVIRAFDRSGPWEAPAAPRLGSSAIFRTKARKKAAEKLQAKIKALLPASNGLLNRER